MAKFWYKRIKGDASRIGEVPGAWRAEVQAMIDADKS